MTRAQLKATLDSVVFLLVAPGTMAGLVPWSITGWRSTGPWLGLRVAGALLVIAGVGVLLPAFARFAL